MKIQLRLCVIYLFLVGLGSLLVTSCQKEGDNYSVGDFIVTFGVVKKSLNSWENHVLYLDNGDKFIPVTSSLQLDSLQINQRVLVNFAPYKEEVNSDKSKTIYGKINVVKNILYKNILQLSQSNSDSIGQDPIIVRDSWVTSDSILTVDFKYFMKGAIHYINLAYSPDGRGKENPYILELRHNASGDHQIYGTSGYVSFNLGALKIAGRHKTDFYLRYTDYDGKLIDIPHSISY